MSKLLRFLKPYRIYIGIVFILVFVQSIAELYLPTLMSDIVDVGIVNGDIDYIKKIGIFMLLISTAGSAALVLVSYLSARITAGTIRSLRSSLFTRAESFSLHEFDTIGTASLITRTTNDISQIQQVMIVGLRVVIRAPMLMIGGIIMAVSKDARLSLSIVFVIPIIALAIYLVIRRGIPLFRLQQLRLDKMNRILRETLTGIRVIRAFNRIEYEKRRFDDTNRELTDTAVRVNKIMAALTPLLILVLNYTIIAIVWLGSGRIHSGSMQVGDLMAFIQYVLQITASLIMLSTVFVMIPRASASAVRINEVLETLPEIHDPEAISRESDTRGSVEFDRVAFTYPGMEKPALRDISFVARTGEITAVIGSTGSGKSTLVHLIPRFYDVDAGSIRVDGIDIREMTQQILRSKIGLVPQDSILFSGTVADNIRFGRENASDQEVRQAAETAQAIEFIDKMEDGFESFIAQGGTNVSGGQKQRLAIARALVHKPDIYLLDDSFSALDFQTDARLRTALKKETAHAILILAAQRVSTVMAADQIIVLDEGQIVGTGTHKDLLQTCTIYREIVSSQMSGEESA